MSYDTMLHTLQAMLIGVMIITTAFPLWYGLFNKFWVTRAGISIFLTATVLAVAWDLTGFLQFFPPNETDIETYFWLQFFVMLATQLAGLYLLYALWYNRHKGIMVTTTSKVERDKEEEERDNDSSTR